MSRQITAKDITHFTRQMATLINAGLPILKSLDIILKGHKKTKMQQIIKTIQNNIESGRTLSESLEQFPLLFNPLVCSLIQVGEQSGSLDVMLQQIANYKEKIEHVKREIKKALNYPLFVLIIALLVCIALLTLVVPEFERLFHSFSAELPRLTRLIINLSNVLHRDGPLLLITLLITIILARFGLTHYTRCQQLTDLILMKLPIIGMMIQHAAISRFTRTLAITFTAGLPIIEALQSVAGATGHRLYEKACLQISKEISCGQALHLAMQHTRLFPLSVIQLITIGEESGQLDQMLYKLAEIYDTELDQAINNMSRLLEPIIITILGIVLGIVVIALYLPIFKLGSVV